MANILKNAPPYTIEVYYTDNGREYKGNLGYHKFMVKYIEDKTEQGFTKPKTPGTKDKAERVIRTIMNVA